MGQGWADPCPLCLAGAPGPVGAGRGTEEEEGRGGEGRGGEGRKGRAVIDSSAEPRSRHLQSLLSHGGNFAVAMKTFFFCEHRAPSPSRWGSRVEKLNWRRGGRGALPRQQPARPVPEGTAVPWHPQEGTAPCPESAPGPRGEFNPTPPSSAVRGGMRGGCPPIAGSPRLQAPGCGSTGEPQIPLCPADAWLPLAAPLPVPPPLPPPPVPLPRRQLRDPRRPLRTPHPSPVPALSPPSQSREQSSRGGFGG